MKRTLFALTIAATTLLGACSDDDDNGGGNNPDARNTVQIRDAGDLGNILSNGNNSTLYFFTRDTKGTSNCNDGCLDAWPIYYAEDLSIGNGLNIADFGTITRDDGARQTTYKGWPLYYFSPTGDGVIEDPEETQGEAVGNVWFVAKADYTIMLANAQLVGNDGVNYTSEYEEGEEVTQYFVGGRGRTIYIFINDSTDNNNYTAPDFSNDGIWPIFFEELASVPSIVNKDDFGSIDVFDRQQLTYKGWPLYYFGSDTERGDNKGVSVPQPGIWPIVNTATEAAPQ